MQEQSASIEECYVLIIMFVNLTPHSISVVDAAGAPTLTLPASGIVARCRATATETERVDDIPVFKTVYGEVEGLPEPEAGTLYVVSALVREAVKATRSDVVSPAEFVRDSEGKILGCKGFTR